MSTLVDTTNRFVELAQDMRQWPNVASSSRSCWMTSQTRVSADHVRLNEGAGVRVEWYAEARAHDGRDLIFALHLSWDSGIWWIESYVSTADASGDEDVLIEQPLAEFTDDDELLAALHTRVEHLVGLREEALRLYDARG